MKKFLTLIAVAVMAFIAQANTITVCEGTDYSELLPICGDFYEYQGDCGQMIYPAEMLNNMKGATISEVKFYAKGTLAFYGGELNLSMKIIEKNNFDDRDPDGTGDIVATIVPVMGSSELVFSLSEPFVYEGGNLLLDVWNNNDEGISGTTRFYGVEMSYNASIYIDLFSWDMNSAQADTFLPKVTFTYEPAPVGPEPTEKTGAPTFHGYTEDGIHGYFVEINPTEESVIYYRIIYPDGTETEWTEYEKVLEFEGDGKHRVEAYAVAVGKLPSEQIAYEFVVSPITGIDEMLNGKTVAGVRYFNMAGQEMTEANGMTIVVTTYTDGTTSAVKVMK